jgi:hypothetical protein
LTGAVPLGGEQQGTRAAATSKAIRPDDGKLRCVIILPAAEQEGAEFVIMKAGMLGRLFR